MKCIAAIEAEAIVEVAVVGRPRAGAADVDIFSAVSPAIELICNASPAAMIVAERSLRF